MWRLVCIFSPSFPSSLLSLKMRFMAQSITRSIVRFIVRSVVCLKARFIVSFMQRFTLFIVLFMVKRYKIYIHIYDALLVMCCYLQLFFCACNVCFKCGAIVNSINPNETYFGYLYTIINFQLNAWLSNTTNHCENTPW